MAHLNNLSASQQTPDLRREISDLWSTGLNTLDIAAVISTRYSYLPKMNVEALVYNIRAGRRSKYGRAQL